jgi:hypothetical protein
MAETGVRGDNRTMKTMEIDQTGSELRDSAHELQLAADQEWNAEATIAALARMEQAFFALAASSYEIRGKAAQDAGGAHEQRTVVLDEMAAEFARCARKCRKARLAVRAAEQSGPQEIPATPKLVAL